MATDRISVSHVMGTIESGGVERRHLQLCDGPPEASHQVICTSASGPVADAFLERGIEVVELGEATGANFTRRLRRASRALASSKPDIVHGSIIEGYTVGTLTARMARVPVIVMEETSDPANRRIKGHGLARVMAALADHCIAVSPNVGRYLTDSLRIPSSKVSVISNGVKCPFVPPAADTQALRRELGIGRDDVVVGSVGRMHDETHKRFEDLICAVGRVACEPKVRLVLVGDGRERRALEAQARQMGIAERVHFVGFQPEPGRYYALMDIFALASEREAFGLVNAEAMRAGLPVVATKVGGVPDVVKNDETGFLVPARDIEAMTSAIQRLVDSPELRRRMGAAGKQRADAHFSAERYVREVHDLYRRLLEDPPRRRRPQ